MMKLQKLNLEELEKSSELKKINGGYRGITGAFGYAVGYAIGTVVESIEGAYQSGHDEAQNNCECQ